MLAKPKQPKQSEKLQLNHPLPLYPRGLWAADKSCVVVGHVEREAGARCVEAVLALDGQRQFGLVAGQAQRQEQLDPAAVELRHRERVVGCGAAGGLDDGSLKGTAQQQRVALPHQAGGNARKVFLVAQNVVDVGADGKAVVKDKLGGVLGKAHAARQVLKRDQHGVALLKEALQKPALARVGLGVGLKQAVDGLVAARVQAGVKQASVVVEHQRQVGRRGLVHVALGQKYCAAKRKRQVVLENAVAGTPVLGIGEVGQALVTGLGVKREVVHIAAQGAGDLHMASNQDNDRRVDALILYVRRVARVHNATAAQLVGEFCSRAVSGNKVLDPGVVLVVFGFRAIGKYDWSTSGVTGRTRPSTSAIMS